MKKNGTPGCDPERLSAYADGEIARAERRAQEAHLRSCAACRALLAEFKSLGAQIRRMPSAKAPKGLKESLRRLAGTKASRPAGRRGRRSGR